MILMPVASKERVMNDKQTETDREDFEASYPNPIIHTMPQLVPGLEVIYVYDKSNQAEDPITPARWVRVSDGGVFQMSSNGFARALRRIKFNPSTEKEALAAAQTYLQSNFHESRTILMKEGIERGLPMIDSAKIKKLGVTSPQVTKANGSYSVTLYVYESSPSHPILNPDSEDVIAQYSFVISPNEFKVQDKILWPDNPKGRITQDNQ